MYSWTLSKPTCVLLNLPSVILLFKGQLCVYVLREVRGEGAGMVGSNQALAISKKSVIFTINRV